MDKVKVGDRIKIINMEFVYLCNTERYHFIKNL